jgi:hypothetical protein
VIWVFQYNPRRWDQLRELVGDCWAMNQSRDLVSVGDRVFFWRTGNDASLTGVGRGASCEESS